MIGQTCSLDGGANKCKNSDTCLWLFSNMTNLNNIVLKFATFVSMVIMYLTTVMCYFIQHVKLSEA
jgi:hypothetical protein